MEVDAVGSRPGNDDSFGRQGFGSMRLSDDTADSSDRDPVAVVHAALDAGVTMVDTADAYQNEELVDRAIRGRRDDVLLATKFGLVWHGEVAGDFDVRADAAYVRQACEASLRRLDVDVIDLYYLHHRSLRVPIEETVGAMAELIGQGKVRAIGPSNVTADDLRRAHAIHPISALQEQWALSERGLERELVPTAAELGVAIVAHSPNGHGALHRPSNGPEAHVDTVGAVLDEVANARGVTRGEIALAWVHHRQRAHGVRVVPLLGTTSVRHVLANVAAADIRLSDDELAGLDAVATAP